MDEPQTIGWKPGTTDRHGNDLMPAEIVPEGHPLASHVFTAGAVIPVTEADPQLISFLRSNRMFRRALVRGQKETKIVGLREYLPNIDDDRAIFRDAMQPKHQASDPATRRHNNDRQRERREIATEHGSEDEIFRVRDARLTMRDTPLRKPREEMYCQLISKNVSPTEAYKQAV